VGHNLVPVLVLMAPMLAVMTQLVAHYGYAPSDVGTVQLLTVELAPGAGDVVLDLPMGVALDAPPVRTATGRVFWRLRAEAAGDHVMSVKVGDQTFEKRWAVGGSARKIPVKRVRGWEAALYPGEDALPARAPIRSISLPAKTRELSLFPDGELGILGWAMAVSLIAGFACKDLFGVVL
jgi:hypothetical protein